MGRPAFDNWDKYKLVRKLEPYLKMGLSVRKACSESGVPKSSVYKYLSKDKTFADTIRHFEQFLSVLMQGALFRELVRIVNKQRENLPLSRNEVGFLMWFATHSKATQEEYTKLGKKYLNIYIDPHFEVQRVLAIINQK